MSTVIYLANQRVQIVVGSAGTKGISIQKSLLLDAPESSLVNGIIMNPDSFVEFLSKSFRDNQLSTKDVTLIVNSSKFVGKTIELPALNTQKSYDFIKREYADLGRGDNTIFSFISIQNLENKFKKVYAEGIDPEFIKDYIEIFGKAGIKLANVYSAESSMINFVRSTVAKNHKTFVYVIADRMSITNILWVDGYFRYYNTARVFEEPGSEAYAVEISKHISSVNQFMKSERIESPLEAIYISGVTAETMGLYSDVIDDLGLQVSTKRHEIKNGLLADNGIQAMVHSIAGLFAFEKTVNLLPPYYSSIKKGDKKQTNLGGVISVAVVAFLLLIITVSASIIKIKKASELRALTEYNESPAVQMQITDYNMYSQRSNFLSRQYDAIQTVSDNIETYPLGSSDVLDVFDECARGYATLVYNSFDAYEGNISITANASNVEDINKFIKNLTTKDIFVDVDYTGYHFDDSTNLWNINVTCTLSEAAGR